jgi:peptidoglycan/xylan/chitin deacetylase (PgdA/CDA1 family)
VTASAVRRLAAPGVRARRRARRIAGRAATQLRQAPIILCYHRVADEHFDPWGLCTRPDHFAGHLAAIERSGRTPISLDELRAALAAGHLPRGAVVVTFDDGYADNLEHAAPALAARQVPATVFVSSGLLDATPWWDELADIVGRSAGGSLTIDGEAIALPFDAPPPSPLWRAEDDLPSGPREALYLRLWQELLVLDAGARSIELARIAEALGSPARPAPLMLDGDALVELAGAPGISIGAHTVSHASLTNLDLAGRSKELEDGRQALEHHLSRPVDLLSYPFGHHDDETVAAARRAGFTAAVTTEGRRVPRRADPLRLPRFTIGPMTPAEFSARLERMG